MRPLLGVGYGQENKGIMVLEKVNNDLVDNINILLREKIVRVRRV